MQEIIDDPPEFSDEQLRAALKRMGEEARQKTFSAGLPVMVIEDGKFILIFPDGSRKVTGYLETKSHVEKGT